MATKSKKTWREKLEKPQESKIVQIPERMRKQWGPGTMVIATPMHVDSLVRKIPKGKLVTVTRIMEKLAHDLGADTACPMCTGIFMGIVAKAAEEDRATGRKHLAPYWRVLKTKGALNPKYPGGIQAQAERLEEEGHEIDKTRKTWKVAGFEKRSVKSI